MTALLSRQEKTLDLGGGGSLQWTVSIREADVRNAMTSWNQVWTLANETGEETPLDLEEPLVLTADLLHGVAPVLCTSDHIDKSGCHWYHGTWQYLRLLQLVSTPTWHHEFYRAELANALTQCDSANALITGTADYSMLAYLAEAARQAETRTCFHVLDQCATPLFACRWYAKRADIDIVAHEEDIFHFEPGSDNAGFDILCTDAFLTRFTGVTPKKVLEKWFNLLKPGGRLVTTVRVHQQALTARDPEAAVRDFRDRAVERAKRWEPFLHKSAVEIGEAAEVYARTMQSHPIGDEAEIRSLLESSGFEIATAQLGEVPGELYPTIYLRLACIRNADGKGVSESDGS